MNILLFVMTFLMLLSLMSYARWETFRNFSGFKAEFEHYMRETERGFYNAQAVKWYDQTHATKQAGHDNASTNAISRLTLYPILYKQKDSFQFAEIAKRLMRLLYGSHHFFKEIQEKEPNFLDEIFARLIQVIQNLPKEQQITQASDLANLDLGDPTLNEVFCKMLKGSLTVASQAQGQSSLEEDTSADEKEAEVDEYVSDKGYYSLLDYISMKNKPKLRIFLAPRELLLAIYGDPATVDAVIQERKTLYKLVNDGTKTAQEATTMFKSAFENRSTYTILDFTVSKTNPKQYE